MKIEFTGRHVEVTPAIRSHVENNFKKIEHVFNDPSTSAHVIIDVERSRHIGEVVLHWRDHTLTARVTDKDMYQALTRAIEKLEKQALKLKKKIIDGKQNSRKERAAAEEAEPAMETRAEAPRIILAQKYEVKPMTPEEAALRLAENSDQFIVFRDAETDRIGVLYKRKDGHFGLIEP
ncbi:MAG: ribosome-associated translation inhibitor RaiA [Pyrinomonas sp.]|uniref:ribosome hibernation-promoting factor, HPF/YfiA family n=1 Tax=Pyrinomonas sp. TaxID=2080306 RepID=UPI00332549B9